MTLARQEPRPPEIRNRLMGASQRMEELPNGRGNRPDLEKGCARPNRPGASQKVNAERIVRGDDTLIEFEDEPVVKPMKGPLMTSRRREVSPSSSCWW